MNISLTTETKQYRRILSTQSAFDQNGESVATRTGTKLTAESGTENTKKHSASTIKPQALELVPKWSVQTLLCDPPSARRL